MKNQMTPISFLWQIIKLYKWWYILMLQAPIVTSFYPLLYNYSVKLLIDLFTKYDTLTFKLAWLPISVFIMAHVILDSAWRIYDFAAWSSQPYVRKKIVCTSYDYVAGHSYQFFQNNMSGSIISKIKGISDGYFTTWSLLVNHLISSTATLVISGASLLLINKKIFLIILTFLAVYVPYCIIFYTKLGKLQRKCAEDYHKIIGSIADRITNIFTLFNFATKKREYNNLENYYNKNNIPLQNSWFKLDFWLGIFACLMYWTLIAGVFVYMIHLRNSNQITTGDIAFIIAMVFLFVDNSWNSTSIIKNFINLYENLKSSFSILSFPQEIIDKPNATELKVVDGNITFKNVSFNYETGDKVFENFNLHIATGTKVGIVGHSGAGKSTLISLLLKNFAATSGDIIIDKQNIYDVTSDSLRSQISLIPQDIMLFHRSIGENIAYVKENVTQVEIEDAAQKASIHEIIVGLPNGYDTLVGERGIKLSGGQRQRIAIARAILKNAPILILDEATSSLDSKTEQEIQKSINTMLKSNGSLGKNNNTTVIAIAHRLSTIKHMDRIIVVENGKIIEDGSFSELIAKQNGKFTELWNSQMDGLIV